LHEDVYRAEDVAVDSEFSFPIRQEGQCLGCSRLNRDSVRRIGCYCQTVSLHIPIDHLDRDRLTLVNRQDRPVPWDVGTVIESVNVGDDRKGPSRRVSVVTSRVTGN